MKLYKATYEYVLEGKSTSTKNSLYILAPDFETATKLAETNEKIAPVLKMGGDPASALAEVELITTDIVYAQ